MILILAELVEAARKVTITGFLALVDPGSLLKLYLGVVVALCILILQMYASPYQTLSDNFLSMISASSLVLTMIASLGIQLTELTPELSALGAEQTGLNSNALPLIIVVLVVSALAVLVVALLMFAQQLRAAWHLPFARWASDGLVATPRTMRRARTSKQSAGGSHSAEKTASTAEIGDQYHAFVSHQWGQGQDQARAIKAQLTALVPNLQIFLDVDDLTDIGALEALIDATDVIVVFLAGSIVDGVERSDYMRSTNCLRELRRAVEKEKTIVFVSETDPHHGAVSMEAHQRDCPDDLRHTLDEHPGTYHLPWYRVREYAQVSLRQIAQVILGAELRIPGELLHVPLRVTPTIAGRFHLCATRAATEVAKLLCTEAPELAATDSADQRGLADRYLLYLNGTTWDDVARQAEVEAALAANTPLLLVHEQRKDHGAVPFSTILERTPSGSKIVQP